MPFSSNTNSLKGKLKRIDNGQYEEVQADVEYFSPNQHGGYYGKIVRRYTNFTISVAGGLQTIFTDTDIDKIIDSGGSVSDNGGAPAESNLGGYGLSTYYSGLIMQESTHGVQITIGSSLDEVGDTIVVWVDYTLDVEPVLNP